MYQKPEKIGEGPESQIEMDNPANRSQQVRVVCGCASPLSPFIGSRAHGLLFGPMGRWSRDELEKAFALYLEAGARAGAMGDWSEWPEIFTEDATYIEHHFGIFHGRDEIRAWITDTMSQFPGNEMDAFPAVWYVIDEERGWVVAEIINRMKDVGDGQVHQATNLTVLKYAGDGLWSSEEDVYNPARFIEMIQEWSEAKQKLSS